MLFPMGYPHHNSSVGGKTALLACGPVPPCYCCLGVCPATAHAGPDMAVCMAGSKLYLGTGRTCVVCNHLFKSARRRDGNWCRVGARMWSLGSTPAGSHGAHLEAQCDLGWSWGRGPTAVLLIHVCCESGPTWNPLEAEMGAWVEPGAWAQPQGH